MIHHVIKEVCKGCRLLTRSVVDAEVVYSAHAVFGRDQTAINYQYQAP